MKITPLAVWTQNLTAQGVADAVKSEVEIIHPKMVMPNLVTCYCLAIRFLIKNHSEEDRAQRAFDIAREHAKLEQWHRLALEYLDVAKSLVGKENEEGFLELKKYNPQINMGSVKHAFVLAFYCLLRVGKDFTAKGEEAFDFAMRQTAMLAGDADTNCAIVGGLVGAFVGIKAMPAEKVKKVLECNLEEGEQQERPEIVKVANDGLDCIMQLLAFVPRRL